MAGSARTVTSYEQEVVYAAIAEIAPSVAGSHVHGSRLAIACSSMTER